MKKSLFIILALMFLAAMDLPVLAEQAHSDRIYRQTAQNARPDMGQLLADNDHSHYHRDHGQGHDRDRDWHRDYDHDWHHHWDGRYEYRYSHHYPWGYRNQRFGRHDEHPHYWRHHRYRYDGHWNSWRAWNAYRRHHPDWFHGGRYVREDGHLFFRFCDPLSGGCYFFSLGR